MQSAVRASRAGDTVGGADGRRQSQKAPSGGSGVSPGALPPGLRTDRFLAAEMGEHGEDPPMVVRSREELEL
jgi:hypothetical protein